MYSLIVPTMWRYKPFIPFLKDLVEFHLIDEIIIIDNNPNQRPIDVVSVSQKITFYSFGSNIFVNPAWNHGVALAKNNKICILNDDLIFDLRTFYRVNELLDDPTTGMIGIAPGDHPTLTGQPRVTDGKIDIIPHTNEHLWGIGMFFFINKKNWQPIPDELKMFYGDNWIFDGHKKVGRVNYLITNSLMFTPYSVTSRNFAKDFDIPDRDLYAKLSAERIYV